MTHRALGGLTRWNLISRAKRDLAVISVIGYDGERRRYSVHVLHGAIIYRNSPLGLPVPLAKR